MVRRQPRGDVTTLTPAQPRQRPEALIAITVLLVAALAALGAAPTLMPASYDWVELGVSESAAQGVDGAWAARLGFLLFGLAVLWLASLRTTIWGRLGTLFHVGFAVSMFGVAAFSTKPWQANATYVESEDFLHSLFATVMGFCFILGVVAVLFARQVPSLKKATPDLIALIVTITIPMLISISIWGLLQRLMFLTAAAWYSREAWLPRLL